MRPSGHGTFGNLAVFFMVDYFEVDVLGIPLLGSLESVGVFAGEIFADGVDGGGAESNVGFQWSLLFRLFDPDATVFLSLGMWDLLVFS